MSRITLSTPVAPTAGRQEHYVVIQATFKSPEGAELRKEQVRVSVAYEADLSFFCEPQRLLIGALQSAEARRTVYIRSRALDALNVRDIRISPEGLRIEKMRRFVVPTLDRPGEQALAITIVCLKDKPGLDAGTLSFRTSDPTIPEFSIPIEISTREALVSDPAGFALIIKPGETERKQIVEVSSRDGNTVGADRCALVHENGSPLTSNGIRAEIVRFDSGGVRIALTALPSKLAPEGIAAVAVMAADGTVLRRIPVAWVKLARSQPLSSDR